MMARRMSSGTSWLVLPFCALLTLKWQQFWARENVKARDFEIRTHKRLIDADLQTGRFLFRLRGGALQVEGQQALQDLLVGDRRCAIVLEPAVGVEGGAIRECEYHSVLRASFCWIWDHLATKSAGLMEALIGFLCC